MFVIKVIVLIKGIEVRLMVITLGIILEEVIRLFIEIV